MRHHKNTRTLGRTKRQRVALLRGLARSLVLEGGITTTAAKAKELRPYMERLVTASKVNTLQSKRIISERLGNAADAVKRLHDTIAPRYMSRAGGYTRVIKLGRIGKRVSESARIEFVQ
ncbi:MAG: large subunit ribosomal protein L17 [Parcubacteria group bacterium Gr01-1014_8]|nr:MAG: large subunit ribosomal protein L17 [Parcubacteria group bacterium Gr01-1014_8]